MVGGCESAIRSTDLTSSILQAFEGLRGGDFMDQVTI